MTERKVSLQSQQNLPQGLESIHFKIMEQVCDTVINGKINAALGQMLSFAANRKSKSDLDSIREECKQTMYSVIYHLISAICLNDSDKWFSILGTTDPIDTDLEVFLDFVDKNEEIVYEMQSQPHVATQTENQIKLIKELGGMLYNL